MSVNVTLRCSECGGGFDVTARRARMIRAEKRTPTCPRCRSDSHRHEASRVISDAERKYWTDRFGVRGATELALAIWGPIRRAAPASMETEVEYLVASAAPQDDLQSVA